MTVKLTDKGVWERYAEVPLLFDSYYKYSFGFSGVAPNGDKVYKSVGGDSNDIYRYEVGRDAPEFIEAGQWTRITDKEGAEIFAGELRARTE